MSKKVSKISLLYGVGHVQTKSFSLILTIHTYTLATKQKIKSLIVFLHSLSHLSGFCWFFIKSNLKNSST